MYLRGRTVSISKSISLSIFISIVIITVLSLIITSIFITNRFHEQAKNSSRLASRIAELSLNQYINRIVSGIDSIGNDSELTRDTLLSLASPNPRQKNFYEFLYRVKEFGDQYDLEQISIYLRPSDQRFRLFGSIDVKNNHVFSYNTMSMESKLKELDRDEYGFIAPKLNGIEDYNFAFPLKFNEISNDIRLITKNSRLYLALTYPLVNTTYGSELDEGQYLVKGMTYGYFGIVVPMPETFLSQLEGETGLRISFFDLENAYLVGINQQYSPEESYTSQGEDGRAYLNYLSPIVLFDQKVAQISTSLNRAILYKEIFSMLAIIMLSIGVSSAAVLTWLNRSLSTKMVEPLRYLSKTADTSASGDLGEWRQIAATDKKEQLNEIISNRRRRVYRK